MVNRSTAVQPGPRHHRNLREQSDSRAARKVPLQSSASIEDPRGIRSANGRSKRSLRERFPALLENQPARPLNKDARKSPLRRVLAGR
ncbi:hypothetical protein AUG19_00420 [archaeon 13_1_20CM_2_54_9]|nr:MAG: hypothetical protein AUG19_00420 [archaeon 13_1_20CM_2_54_9]